MKAPELDRGTAAACAVAIALAVAGCDSGDTGPAGPAGPGGGAGVPVTSSATGLVVNVDSVSFGNPSVVELTVTNEQGTRYVGLASPGFTLAKLVPGTNGAPSAWQSYINRTEAADGNGPGTEDTVQATTDSGGAWQSHGDGTYTYTFGKNVTNMTTPLAVSYQPTLTHRLGIQIRAGATYPATNPVYDFRPSDGATTGLVERDIVQTASCNECHNKLAVHGGSRVEARFCVTCHNPGTVDANSTNTVDFKVMIHKIHRGHDLPSVVAGGEYAIWGFNDTKHDYSELGYPQDIRNCTKCHDAADAATPQANNWQDVPSIEACGSCHDNVDFEFGTNHGPGGFGATNADCTFCHAENKIAGTVAESHVIPARVESAKFKYTIVSVAMTAPGAFPEVTYKVTDPTNGDAPYNLTTGPTWTTFTGGVSRLAIDLGWSTEDYHNTGNGSASTPASAISLDALRASAGNNNAPVANGDGTYTVTSLRAVPATGAAGSGVAAIEGHPAADYDRNGTFTDRVPVKSAVAFFPITDATATARRNVVDIAKCNKCHDQLTLHGSNRTDEPQICVICHNANNTDISRRSGVAGVDGKREESIDFKTMIHGIHAAAMRVNPITVYGFGGSVHTFDPSVVHFPGILSDCNACHLSETFTVPLAAGVLANTIGSGASLGDPTDDTNITPTAAVCSSCHDTDVARTHMEQNGANFNYVGGTFDPAVGSTGDNETCSVCHGPGRLADVAEVHALAP